VLDNSGIDPHRLTIEITETVLLNDLITAAGELDAVRALGVRVAIDDLAPAIRPSRTSSNYLSTPSRSIAHL